MARLEPELIDIRRDLHVHPERSREEFRTTAALERRLRAAGLTPRRLPAGTGLYCDVGAPAGEDAGPGGSGPGGIGPGGIGPGGIGPAGVAPAAGPGIRPVVMLRADIDALPLTDVKDVPYASSVPGVCHACGHDVHTAALLGAGLALAGYVADASDGASPPLAGTVRLVFQPAEEVVPGGALDVIDAGVLAPVTSALSLHCDPALDVGTVGLRVGPLTAAADMVDITLAGPGGHTSRPHNTVDLVQALATIALGLPATLARLVDPRAVLSLVWGRMEAGTVSNAIPRTGALGGTVRTFSRETWDEAPKLVEQVAAQLAAPYGATVTIDYRRGVPPVVNDAGPVEALRRAVAARLGPSAEVGVAQSLGGEDFGWYLRQVPGGVARLGTRVPGGPTLDLHQPAFDVDERAIAIGAGVLAVAALDLLTPA